MVYYLLFISVKFITDLDVSIRMESAKRTEFAHYKTVVNIRNNFHFAIFILELNISVYNISSACK